jgi:AbrB family looped-hinge helix DNA binding protein
MKTVVSERGQIVIPKKIRDRLGLKPGQELECREERGAFVAVKASRSDPIAAVYGILKTPRRSDEWLEALRGKGK